jgi:RNA polymerase sigma-70 factor, ECF subfamily
VSEDASLSSSFLLKLKQMQPGAWSRLVESFSPIVYAWCRKAGLRGEDAADVVQDVFASVAKGLRRFERVDPSDSFRAWMATITRTRIADFFRKNHKVLQGQGGTSAYRQLAEVPDLQLDATSATDLQISLSQRVLHLIEDEFEPQTWAAFWNTSIQNRLPREVAEELNISLASVYQARCRVLRRLKQRLAELPQ